MFKNVGFKEGNAEILYNALRKFLEQKYLNNFDNKIGMYFFNIKSDQGYECIFIMDWVDPTILGTLE